MVLRKARTPSEAGIKNSSSLTSSTTKTMSTNEQPVNKRQRIENLNENDEPESDENSKISSSSSSSTTSINQYQDGGHDELDRSSTSMGLHRTSLLGENDHSLQNLLNYPNIIKLAQTSSIGLRPVVMVNSNNDNDIGIFQSYLKNQCLCSASERVLRKPFQSHYSNDLNGAKRIAPLTEWPQIKLLQFLSNLQLLFEIYLKQNQKGNICARIMDVCDALIRNEHNLIDEIIDLCDYNNRFVTFLAVRVLSSFLVISKDSMDSNWLKKVVNNLFLFETLDYVAVRKISFSLDIIKRIVEWKDVEVHPLDANTDEDVNEERDHIPMPPIETNYFAQYYTQNNPGTSSSNNTSSISSSNNRNLHSQQSTSRNHPPPPPSSSSSSHSDQLTTDCQIIVLTDSESFDTTNLKCVTIQILENKWPALVKNMSSLIISHYDMNMAENCVTTFLTLWENIISVRANLSVIETLPFYAQLDKFALLLNQNLSCTIYKQILTLFNEALCYGSTLALQDLLPEETCNLAHQVVRHVKDYRILDSLPRQQPENHVGLLEYIGRPLQYLNGTFDLIQNEQHTSYDTVDMDRTLLQKMVLLVLKSVAVTVKEIRSDSSDSSIDSTDYDAFEDLRQIVRSIRDVLKKLENFIKNTLEFHPESHFSKLLIHLFNDQDDYLIEAMVCTLDVTAGISFRNNAFPELVSMLNPVYTFLEFLKMISNSPDLLLDLLVNNETCFLLYLLRFLKYIRLNWSMFVQSCRDCGMGNNVLDDSMGVLIRLRLKISRLVSKSLYPYDISPILRLLESCESLYEGNELS